MYDNSIAMSYGRHVGAMQLRMCQWLAQI